MVVENNETATIEINRIKAEVSNLLPFEPAGLPGVKVKAEVFFGLCDQKCELCKNGIDSTHRCPKCGKLPREYKDKEQDPLDGTGDYTPEGLFDLIFSPLHLGPRCGEYFIRLACLIYTFGILLGGNVCGPKHPLRYKFDRMMEIIINYYLNRNNGLSPVVLYKAKEGGAGNTNCGNAFK